MKNKIRFVLILVAVSGSISGCIMFDAGTDQIQLEQDEGGSGY